MRNRAERRRCKTDADCGRDETRGWRRGAVCGISIWICDAVRRPRRRRRLPLPRAAAGGGRRSPIVAGRACGFICGSNGHAPWHAPRCGPRAKHLVHPPQKPFLILLPFYSTARDRQPVQIRNISYMIAVMEAPQPKSATRRPHGARCPYVPSHSAVHEPYMTAAREPRGRSLK